MKIFVAGLFIMGIIICVSSCREEQDLNKLYNRNFLYYSGEDTVHPFSGIGYWKDTIRDIEKIMSDYTFKRGIPKGKWKAYGHEHEVLMEGELTPITELSQIRKDFPNLIRINIDRYTEGDTNLRINIYLISRTPSQDSINYKFKKNNLIDFLLESGHLIKYETPKIYDWVVTTGEFSDIVK